MPSRKPRFMVTVDEDLLAKIEDYRFNNRCKSQTQAINQLIDRGISVLMADIEAKKEEPVTMDGLGEDERRFIEVWRDLNPANQRLLLEIGAVILRSQETPAD